MGVDTEVHGNLLTSLESVASQYPSSPDTPTHKIFPPKKYPPLTLFSVYGRIVVMKNPYNSHLGAILWIGSLVYVAVVWLAYHH